MHINVSCHAFFLGSVGHDSDLSNHQTVPSTPSILTPKASAKVLIPIKTKETNYEDASEKSTSGAPGDILGLASYDSDEEDEDIQSSGKLNSKESSLHQQSSSSKLFEGNNPVTQNGVSRGETEEQRNLRAKLETDAARESLVSSTLDHSVGNTEFNDNRVTTDLTSGDGRRSSERPSGTAEDQLQHGSDFHKINNSLTEKDAERNIRPDGNLDTRRFSDDDSQVQSTGNRYEKNDRLENKRSSVKKVHRDSESSKERLDKKGDEEHGKHARSERTDYHDISKDKGREKGRTDEKLRNTESRKRPPSSDDGKEGTTETQRDRRTSGRKDNDEKRHDRTGEEKKDRSRHKSGNESSRHKRHRSSSVDVRGRESKDHSMVSHANHSSGESSDDSKRYALGQICYVLVQNLLVHFLVTYILGRKSHHSKRRSSPSPIRRRKRYLYPKDIADFSICFIICSFIF